ncbi:hypothetical protein GEMRC1_013326 [Eukaryota sp. GEM-RC1]
MSSPLVFLLVLLIAVYAKPCSSTSQLESYVCSLPAIESVLETDHFDVTIRLHPCRPTDITPVECSSRACMTFMDSAGGEWWNIGNVTDRIVRESDSNNIVLRLIGGDRCRESSPDGYSSRISFICDSKLKRGQQRIETGSEFPDHPCPADLQPWTFNWYVNDDFVCVRTPLYVIVLLLVFGGLIIYCVLGAAYKGLVQGMTGIELLP